MRLPHHTDFVGAQITTSTEIRRYVPMTIIEDTHVNGRPPIESAPADHGASAGPSRNRRVLAAVAAIAIAGGLGIVAVQNGASKQDDQTRTTPLINDRVVGGVGPYAVYVGPAPEVGGDPVRGETDESYFARTGLHLPGLSQR
jgi:hypothetical protein